MAEQSGISRRRALAALLAALSARAFAAPPAEAPFKTVVVDRWVLREDDLPKAAADAA
jgi:hypothetical protein